MTKVALQEYETSARKNDLMAKCAAAGAVVFAFSFAGDKANEEIWKKREREDCDAFDARGDESK